MDGWTRWNMTIKEIAQLAGVSISTVSKIVNGKDKSINAATRERVLKIVKDYHYVPYAAAKAATQAKTFLVGVLINHMSQSHGFLQGILDKAQEYGYSVLVCDNNGDLDEELKNITALCKNKVDGVIWDRVSEQSNLQVHHFENQQIVVCMVNNPSDPTAVSMDLEQVAYYATVQLTEKMHSKIVCMAGPNTFHMEQFLAGFQKCLYENQIPFQERLIIDPYNESAFEDMLLQGTTGAVCVDMEHALILLEKLRRRKFEIPNDFSIVVLCEDAHRDAMYPNLSYVRLPLYEFGLSTSASLIEKLENKVPSVNHFITNCVLVDRGSIALPMTARNKKIVVVGNINMDIVLNTDEAPQVGKVVMVDNYFMMPGGKGANQAVAVARLEHEVALIGRVGKDYESQIIFEALHENHINMSGISIDQQVGTGKAYIYVQADGDSSILIYSGANQNLSALDVMKNERLFEQAGFCLLQTEIPIQTVECAVELAHQHGVRIILKPSASHQISDALIGKIDYFVPNKKEIKMLCPTCQTLEGQADYFLEKGAGTVIVTLGHHGCYVKNKELSEYFPAGDFVPVDTTGAADAFIAALSVYLMNGKDLRTAIRYATCAAGFSITRQGVTSALIDKNSLESYMHKYRKD